VTTVVNFFAGPSAGKSTLAAQLFGIMKQSRWNVEFVPEFAKELVWEESSSIQDQLFMLGVQHNRLYKLLDKVDWIITDSPLLLGNYYVDYTNDKFKYPKNLQWWRSAYKKFTMDTFDLYDNINFFVDRRDRKFIQEGRLQNEEESKRIDDSIRFLLKDNGYAYTTVSNVNDVINMIEIRSENGRVDSI
jgi:hypothetical protein